MNSLTIFNRGGVNPFNPLCGNIFSGLCLMLFAAAYSSFGQSQNWWRVNGNTPAASDYLGTQNNTPLIIKTNNSERARITESGRVGIGTTAPSHILDVNGQSRFRLKVQCDSLLEASMLKITGLAGGTGILNADASGNVNKILYTGHASDVLTGAGTFTSLHSLLPSPLWQQNGSGIFYNGNVGINKSNPQFALDITGDLNVSHNVYVGGGVVIAKRADLDTADFGGGRIAGNGNAVEVIGDLKANNKLQVQGNATFNGQLTSTQGYMFDSGLQIGMKYIANSSVPGGNFVYGKTVGGPAPFSSACAATVMPYFNHQFGGMIQLYATDSNGNYAQPTGGLLNIQSFTSGVSSIDASVGGSVSTLSGLLINYFCGSDTYINTGNNGGKVSMGKIVEVGMPTVTNTNVALNVFANSNRKGLTITTQHTQDYGYAALIDVNRNATKALGIINSSGQSYESFAVWGNGYLEIKCNPQQGNLPTYSVNPRIMSIRDISVSGGKDIFVVNADGKVYAREVEVSLAQNFPDFVFEKDYKKLSIDELEQFILKEKHLPHFKNGTVYEKNGMNLNEIILKQQQTIEELSLYIIELKKDIDNLKKNLK